MFDTSTLWFDAAVVLGLFAVGSILFGHFEEHKPKWRRLLKVAIVLGVVLTLSATVGRAWAFGLLALPILGAAYVHLVWLPKHGIHGWTGEPRDRYLELVTRKPGRGGAATALVLATLGLGGLAGAAVAEEAPAHGATGLFLIHAEAPSPGDLPEPGPDRRIARYDYSFLDLDEKPPPKYLLLANDPDVPLLLAESPETVEGERGRPELLLQLTEVAAEEMERVTRENIGRSAAFVIDGDVVTAHKIRTVIEGGRIQLSRCTDDACELIAVRLQQLP